MVKKKENDKEEEIRMLKEKIKKLEEAKAGGREDEAEGIVGGILKGVGGIIPGLEGLLKGLVKSPAFKERLGKIEKEIEHKIREAPLRRTEGMGFGIPGGIPPGVRRESVGKRPFVKKDIKPEAPPPVPKEWPVDIFDEENHVLVVAEIPGAEEETIAVKLERDRLTIQADKAGKKYYKELILPCVPKGELNKTYKNGILEVRIRKTP